MPLRIVMPVSQKDINQLAANVDLFRALGGAPRHHVMLCPTRSVIPHAHQAAERMKAWAASVEVIEWNDENYHPQPLAGNLMWQHCAEEILKKLARGDQMPWFFMEADVTPLKEGWADSLERDYALSGCQCMGTRMPSRFITGKDANNRPTFTTAEYIEGQPVNIPFMVGAAIYPADIHTLTQGTWRMPKGESWDKTLKFYWNRSLHVTGLIQHQWRTENFREVDGKIICDDSKANIEQQYKEAGELSATAVVHHGCKDGSLAKIIRSRCTELPSPPPPIEVIEQPRHQVPTQPAATANRGAVKFDNAGWQVLQSSLQMAGAQQPVMEPQKSSVPPLVFEPQEAPKYQEPQADPSIRQEFRHAESEETSPPTQALPKLEPVVVKRKGGRPRKHPLPVS